MNAEIAAVQTKSFLCLRCGACCGPVACSSAEWTIIVKYIKAHGILPTAKADEITCLLLGADNLCMIYPVRPTLCCLHGHVPKMVCPNNTKADMMSTEQERLLARALPLLEDGHWLFCSETFTEAGIQVKDAEAEKPAQNGLF